jgi:hypothetical protein
MRGELESFIQHIKVFSTPFNKFGIADEASCDIKKTGISVLEWWRRCCGATYSNNFEIIKQARSSLPGSYNDLDRLHSMVQSAD